MNKASLESLKALLFALNLQGNFANTVYSRQIRRFFEEGAETNLIKPLLKRIPQQVWALACEELETADRLGISTLAIFEKGYPSLLLQIEDPPPLIFYRGQIEEGCRLAVVGTRKASSYGARVARNLGELISEAGGIVVSGLAYGIDAHAHSGALDSARGKGNSPGIAVLGSGFSQLYPRRNQGLAEALIEEGGAVLSEYGIRQHPRKDLFPRRNRIISGLSLGAIVVEAAKRSGSLITARLALEQNREVFALPGPIDSPYSAGTNELLRQGAEVLSSLSELYERYPTLKRPRPEESSPVDRALDFFPKEKRRVCLGLYEHMRLENSCSIQELADSIDLSTQEIYPLLSRLELEGFIERQRDQRYRLRALIDS